MSDSAADEAKSRPRFHRAYSFGIVTAGFFLLSWIGQLVFQAIAVRDEATQHGARTDALLELFVQMTTTPNGEASWRNPCPRQVPGHHFSGSLS